jgi:hypothetical protein
MLGLSAEEGDVAIRTDNSKTYILAGSDPTDLSNWKELTSAGAVTSVNGQTGTVSLSTTNISEGTNQYYTAAKVTGVISSRIYKSNWSGTNSITITHNFDSPDYQIDMYELVTNQPVFVDNIERNYNTTVMTLPTGQLANFRVVLTKK